ncbi:MAG: DUF255 domain-containing protein [Deltaproteobacteria bacterium]|nr:DUF255 domain-containing protein [Deltaproteobacteria bacterium]
MAVNLGYRNVYRDPQGFPQWAAAGLPVESVSSDRARAAGQSAGPGPLQGWPLLWALLGVFMGGLALNLTPCVYPLIPITVSYFGGRTGQSRAALAVHGGLYVVGLGMTNSALGVAAALTGSFMGAALQSPAVLVGVAVALLFFAASLFGLWELRLPSALMSVASRSYTGYFGALFMGLTLGIVAAPCVGPFVLGLLTWVASLGNPWLGFVIFFTLSLGLGLPLFFLGVLSGSLENLPRSGEWMLWVRKVMGWALVGMAAYFVRPILPEGAGVFLLAGVALAAGIHVGWIDQTTAAFRAFGFFKNLAGTAGTVVGAFLIGSWLMAAPGVSWQQYSDELLEKARAQGKSVVMDFSASWCTPCRELDEITFRNPEVARAAAGDFVMIKVDVTGQSDTKTRELISRYSVKGVPTVVFLDDRGEERQSLRLVDYAPPDQVLARMAQLRK